ncbi:glycosyltransferase [Kocuria sp. cx-455]|uniref:glycosyltransferase n=1 Tax=Kocuria sp. cx-455 TaxID=2771377 RepID=UPI0016820718|nr:glycosyltransferase [Kocuria sp. cx-455]MBD2765024.1 glycosyltransferase [Kocuria sp. cx-455]
MHPDERRDPRHLKELVYAQAAREPRATFDALERANASLRGLQAKAEAQRAKLATVTRQHRALAQENRDLAEELAQYRKAAAGATISITDSEAGSEVAASSGDNEQATSTEEVAPVAVAQEATEGGEDESSDIPRDMDPTADEDPDASALGEGPERLISEMGTSEVLDAFHGNPDAPLLAGCLNRLWYREGEIDRAERLIRDHRNLVGDLNSRQRELVDRILGTVSLRENLDQLIPQRVRGAAYHPEHKRVLYCAYSTPIFHSNGYSVRTEGVVAGLKASGADVTVLARAGYPWDITTADAKPRKRRHVVNRHGLDWVHLPEGNISAQGPHEYINVAADAVVRQAKLSRPSVIHAASNYLNALPALIAARRLGLPFVYEVRGLWEVTEASTKPGWDETERYANQAFLETLVAREADAVLAITQEVREELIRRGVPADRISLLPNGVDTGAFLPLPRDEAYAKRHKIRTDVPVIGFAGSFVEYEGLHSLLQAANILRGRKVKFHMVLAGADGVYGDLKEYQKKNRLQGTVRFLGRRPSAEIPRVMSCIDIVACPRLSLPVTEMVSPLKPLEAFSASKPVVLSDVSPHRILVGADQGTHQGPRGILSAAGDPKSLANALQRLIENPEERIAMGQAGRLWVVDERQWVNLGDSVREAYRSASENYDRLAAGGRHLKNLRIGLIADEFTTETLNRSVTIVPLDLETYAEQIRAENLDLVFIESAWSGNEGQWHRKVGHYSDEEHETFRDLLKRCQEMNVPTVFWNKEDPVHINRFRRTGALCDHVFTTDADMIPEYLSQARTLSGGRALTASSMPFYAQPAIHNPLPGNRPLENTVSYAGTYYGERYAERSQQLANLLRTAKPYGLAIYDRQAAYADSPYQFPSEFKASVRGALPYDQVIDSYRAHAASLNVNSVAYSPSMYSRRVVEIAACGGAVLSGWSRGVAETFDGAIPSTNNEYYFKALLSAWTSDPRERLSEVWLQLRTVLRAHTVDTALVILARTAGIAVAGFALPTWGADVEPGQVRGIIRQSAAPAAVRLARNDDGARTSLEEHGIRVLAASSPIPEDVAFWGSLPEKHSRTWAEDLLQATRWGHWQKLTSREFAEGDDARHFAVPGENVLATSGLVASSELSGNSVQAELTAPGLKTLTLTVPRGVEPRDELVLAASSTISLEQLGTVLIAGHDLKFAESWIEHLRELGVSVLVDRWENHAHHDEQRSRELLSRADTVFCEWGLGNAVWYSQHVSENHRLVVRVHAQELRGPYLRKINHAAVNQYIFVSELMREAAIASHGVPRAITSVIPNIVRAESLAMEKTPHAVKTLGFVGMVPQMKRLDRAIDVIETILEKDPEFTLRVKGKRPEDYPWMLKREQEMAWYGECYERAQALNDRHGREVVAVDPHGDDMAEWYRGIGYGISLSDHESFHLTLPDVAASGGVPVSLDWPGADLIYPRGWLVPSPEHMAGRILHLSRTEHERLAFAARAATFARERFDERSIFDQLDITLSPGPRGAHA